VREPARQTFKIGKNPVTALVPKLAQGPIEKDVVVHDSLVPLGVPFTSLAYLPPGPHIRRAQIRTHYLDPDQEIRWSSA
jgi:hypothetical protein